MWTSKQLAQLQKKGKVKGKRSEAGVFRPAQVSGKKLFCIDLVGFPDGLKETHCGPDALELIERYKCDAIIILRDPLP